MRLLCTAEFTGSAVEIFVDSLRVDLEDVNRRIATDDFPEQVAAEHRLAAAALRDPGSLRVVLAYGVPGSEVDTQQAAQHGDRP